MVSFNLDIPREEVQTFSFTMRRPDGPWGEARSCECNLHMAYRKDQYGRGLGDIWGRGYGPTVPEAYEDARADMFLKYTERLKAQNDHPQALYVGRLEKDKPASISTEKLAEITKNFNLDIDL